MLPALWLALLAQAAVATQALLLPGLWPGKSVWQVHPKKKFTAVLTNVDGQGMEYTAEMKIGGQKVKGIMDTGSYELLVFSTLCESCINVSSYYNESRSSSHRSGHLTTEHTFTNGNTWSRLSYDRVEFGDLQVDNQYFWQVIGTTLPVASTGDVQAIVGIGPPSTPRSDMLAQAHAAEKLTHSVAHSFSKEDPGLESRKRARDMAHETMKLGSAHTVLESFDMLSFSVCLGREEGSDGYFMWNENVRNWPPGLFTAVPVVGNKTWGVRMAQVRLEPKSGTPGILIGCEDGCGAIIDTGTSLIVVPTKVAERAAEEIQRLHTDCSNLDELPDLSFELAGSIFSLPPRAYVGQFTGVLDGQLTGFATHRHKGMEQKACELLLMTMNVEAPIGDVFILGLPFFREYYTTFELGSGIWDDQGRSLLIAHSDGNCTPEMPPAPKQALTQSGMRHVNLSRVWVPDWAKSAAARGYVHL